MEYLLALVVLAAMVALFVAGPLRTGVEGGGEVGGLDDSAGTRSDGVAEAPAAPEAERRAELEAAKEAKYREIRDAELDWRMGKLSDDDFRATDRELRAQALAILRRLDELEAVEGGPAPAGSHGAGEAGARTGERDGAGG